MKPLCLLLLLPLVASAEMYRWVDKDGKTHFTQTPPPAGVQAATVAPAPPPPPASGAARLNQYDDAYQQRARDAVKRDAEAAVKRQERAPKCEKARTDLQSVQGRTAYRQGEIDASGNVTRMTPERQAELAGRAQLAIDKFCD